MSEQDSQRPSVPMSQEEHTSLQEVKSEVRGLSVNLDKFCLAVDKRFTGLEEKQAKQAENGRFQRGDWFSLITVLGLLGGLLASYVSMSTDNKLAPIVTQNQVSINDRAGLHADMETMKENAIRGKADRLANEKEVAVEMAVQKERTAELFFKQFGHYPRN